MPDHGAQRFLQTEDGQRLLNVAISRAQAKIVVLMSRADAANPLLARIVHRLRLAADDRAAVPLAQLAGQPGFPASALGRKVRAGRFVGEVTSASADGAQFWMVNERTGAQQVFDAAFWRARAQAAPVSGPADEA